MSPMEFEELLQKVHLLKAETQTIEIKAAHQGCPMRLYDTLSSFSNQDDGGVILFGVDEKSGFQGVGVYDAQDLQKKVTEQCNQMFPIVRPLFSALQKDSLTYVTAEIPGIDLVDRPCYYAGKGRLKGSFIRVGDADEPMTEYEVYSYEAFRKKYQDDVRPVERATLFALDKMSLTHYLAKLKVDKPNLAQLDDQQILELMSVTREGAVTLSAVFLFSPYPQAYFPQLCITAVTIPGTEIGELGAEGERFTDNRRIEGNISKMLDEGLAFVRNNMRTKVIIDQNTGKRLDKTDYPITAVREALLNALVHRDYSIHTEGMPVQLLLFTDRMEIRSPGGLYGRLRIDQLGKVQPDTRNPVLATALETLGETENRYSGIPTIRREMKAAGLLEPLFSEERGAFVVRFYRSEANAIIGAPEEQSEDIKGLLLYCSTPRTRKEIVEYLGLSSVTYAIKRHVMPLVAQGLLEMSIPEKPGSPKQLFMTRLPHKGAK